MVKQIRLKDGKKIITSCWICPLRDEEHNSCRLAHIGISSDTGISRLCLLEDIENESV